MPKWKKDATEFNVSINDDGNGSHLCRIPKPIMIMLGQPDNLTFHVKNKKIVIETMEK